MNRSRAIELLANEGFFLVVVIAKTFIFSLEKKRKRRKERKRKRREKRGKKEGGDWYG